MNLDFISKTALFRGCPKDDIRNMAKHLGFRTHKYKKGTVIFSEGSITANLGLIISGSIRAKEKIILAAFHTNRITKPFDGYVMRFVLGSNISACENASLWIIFIASTPNANLNRKSESI